MSRMLPLRSRSAAASMIGFEDTDVAVLATWSSFSLTWTTSSLASVVRASALSSVSVATDATWSTRLTTSGCTNHTPTAMTPQITRPITPRIAANHPTMRIPSTSARWNDQSIEGAAPRFSPSRHPG